MTDQAPAKPPKKPKTRASTRGKKTDEPNSKHARSKNPKNHREAERGEQEQSTAVSKRQQKKKGKKGTSKASKNNDLASTPLAGTPGAASEIPTGTSTLSAISTTTTTSTSTTTSPLPIGAALIALTPPTGHKAPGGSTRKVKATTPTAPVEVTVPPPSTKHPVTPATGGITEKWAAESTAKGWIEKADYGKARADFDRIQSLVVDVDKQCKKWKSNGKWNQSDEYPALDHNLVKVDGEYCNMSLVNISLSRPVLLGQLPVTGGEEAFWKAVFEKRATMIHILVGNESTDFFPSKAEDYRNCGTMWINNRRVEVVNEDISRFLIEVLPHGCSNSIVCNVTLIKNWSIDSVHAKHAVVIKETIELTTFFATSPPDELPLIISQHGAGRAGYFLALTAALTKMESKTEPCIADIVKTIRMQRPKAVETLTQYASLYISLFYFIKKKVASQYKPVAVVVEGDKKTAEGEKKTPAVDGEKKTVAPAAAIPTDPLIKKAVELTTLFTNALIAEAQPSLMGTTSTTGGSTALSVTSTKM
ncbi:unnamed protein product [Caenorhabditis brenneri]